jgi:hypothetical protein
MRLLKTIGNIGIFREIQPCYQIRNPLFSNSASLVSIAVSLFAKTGNSLANPLKTWKNIDCAEALYFSLLAGKCPAASDYAPAVAAASCRC